MTWKTGNADEFLEDTMDDKMTKQYEHNQGPTMMETLEWLIQDYDDGSSVALSVVSLRMMLNEYETLKDAVEFLKGDDDGTERCFGCGSMVEQVWHASDEHWTKLSGYAQGDGVLCSRCFDRKAREQGVYLYWSCQLDSFPADILEGKDD